MCGLLRGIHGFLSIALALTPGAELILGSGNTPIDRGLLKEGDISCPNFQPDVFFTVAKAGDKNGRYVLEYGREELRPSANNGREELSRRTADLVRGVLVVGVPGE